MSMISTNIAKNKCIYVYVLFLLIRVFSSIDLYTTSLLTDDPSNWDDACLNAWNSSSFSQAIVPNNTDNAVSSPVGNTVSEGVLDEEAQIQNATDGDTSLQVCVEESVLIADETLPSNQQNFSHDLLIELLEQNRRAEDELNIISENVKKLRDGFDMLMTNSVEQGSLIRLVVDRVGFNQDLLKKFDTMFQDAFRERRLMVTLLSNINKAVIDGRK